MPGTARRIKRGVGRGKNEVDKKEAQQKLLSFIFFFSARAPLPPLPFPQKYIQGRTGEDFCLCIGDKGASQQNFPCQQDRRLLFNKKNRKEINLGRCKAVCESRERVCWVENECAMQSIGKRKGTTGKVFPGRLPG